MPKRHCSPMLEASKAETKKSPTRTPPLDHLFQTNNHSTGRTKNKNFLVVSSSLENPYSAKPSQKTLVVQLDFFAYARQNLVPTTVNSQVGTADWWSSISYAGSKDQKLKIRGALLTTWWNVWLERNRRIFHNNSLLERDVAYLVKQDIDFRSWLLKPSQSRDFDWCRNYKSLLQMDGGTDHSDDAEEVLDDGPGVEMDGGRCHYTWTERRICPGFDAR
uniref:Uncharacterized protein n=1 Tax=Oryza glumipatula TaxID=40148 RepID=A0A0D9Z846_9ORYZ